MEQAKSKTKWKTWHKVILAIIIIFLIIIGKAVNKADAKASAETMASLTPAQKDSIEFANKVKPLFSSWDGSHTGLVKLVKSTMKNPNSFEHVETLYRRSGDNLRLQMKYRGTNGFNAVVTETVNAESDLKGNIIKIL